MCQVRYILTTYATTNFHFHISTRSEDINNKSHIIFFLNKEETCLYPYYFWDLFVLWTLAQTLLKCFSRFVAFTAKVAVYCGFRMLAVWCLLLLTFWLPLQEAASYFYSLLVQHATGLVTWWAPWRCLLQWKKTKRRQRQIPHVFFVDIFITSWYFEVFITFEAISTHMQMMGLLI